MISGVPATGAAGQEPALREQSWGPADAARLLRRTKVRPGGQGGGARSGQARRRKPALVWAGDARSLVGSRHRLQGELRETSFQTET